MLVGRTFTPAVKITSTTMKTILFLVASMGGIVGGALAAEVFGKVDHQVLTNSSATTSSNFSLFAVLDGSRCAESLAYGPSALSETGSEDGYTAYFRTTTSTVHTEWLQVVNFLDPSISPCSIRWTFDTPRTLKDHFITAVKEGVKVSYAVECSIAPHLTTDATWRFSPSAGDMVHKFSVSASTYGFSNRYGVWGTGDTQAGFWGVGNFDGFDENNCLHFHNGSGAANPTGLVMKSTHMYFSTLETLTANPIV